jgi:cytochrome c
MKLTSIMAISAALFLSTTVMCAADLAAGKALYEKTCKNCHGDVGEGNASADTFWKLKIPRLRDSYAQKKSDKELENVILNGKRKMPAVVAVESSHKTKVTAEQTPDLIAFIRTLKK